MWVDEDDGMDPSKESISFWSVKKKKEKNPKKLHAGIHLSDFAGIFYLNLHSLQDKSVEEAVRVEGLDGSSESPISLKLPLVISDQWFCYIRRP